MILFSMVTDTNHYMLIWFSIYLHDVNISWTLGQENISCKQCRVSPKTLEQRKSLRPQLNARRWNCGRSDLFELVQQHLQPTHRSCYNELTSNWRNAETAQFHCVCGKSIINQSWSRPKTCKYYFYHKYCWQ